MSDQIKVGVIGLGIMGGSFARNILDAGFSVVGYDVVEANISSLVDLGGSAAKSPGDVASQSDVVITSLPSVTSLATVLLDCPISGTGAQAATRDLSVYVSGDKLASQKCQSVLDAIANHTFYVGDFGNGSKMKFVANVLVSIHNVATAEALTLGMKAGLEPESIFNVIKAGAGNSRIFELRAPMMVDNDYSNATMKMDVWQKDLNVIGEFAKDLQCQLPLFSASTDVYDAGMDMGHEKLDTASVCKVLEQMAGIERK